MEQFLATYRRLNRGNLELLADIYHDDIHFVDPAHEIHGLGQLQRYFAGLYDQVTEIDFHFQDPLRVGEEAYVQWRMRLRHPRLGGGRPIELPGSSYLRFTAAEKVVFHRDYFDLGAMLYEQLPVLGGIIRALKRRLSS